MRMWQSYKKQIKKYFETQFLINLILKWNLKKKPIKKEQKKWPHSLICQTWVVRSG
jgi:hypothetical protein